MAVGLDAVNYFELLWLPLLMGIAVTIRRQRAGIAARLLLIGLLVFAALTAFDAVIETIDFTRTRYFLIMWSPLMIGLAAALLSLPRPRLTVTIFLLLYAAAGLRLEFEDVTLDYPFRIPDEGSLSYPPLHRYVRGLSGNVSQDDFLIGFPEVRRDLHQAHQIRGRLLRLLHRRAAGHRWPSSCMPPWCAIGRTPTCARSYRIIPTYCSRTTPATSRANTPERMNS